MSDASSIPEITLERYRLGELPRAEAERVRAAIEADLLVRARVDALASSDERIVSERLAGFSSAVARRLGAAADAGAETEARRRGTIAPRAWLVPACAMLVALGVSAALWAPGRSGPGPDPRARVATSGDRVKGAPALIPFRKGSGTAVERLEPGTLAHERDVVQLAYNAGGSRFGVIVSIDGRGIVTRHLPVVGDEAVPLQQGAAAPLAAAYRLDDAPRVERFFLVAANTPFAVTAVVAAARNPSVDPLTSERLPLGQAFVQASFLLRKE